MPCTVLQACTGTPAFPASTQPRCLIDSAWLLHLDAWHFTLSVACTCLHLQGLAGLQINSPLHRSNSATHSASNLLWRQNSHGSEALEAMLSTIGSPSHSPHLGKLMMPGELQVGPHCLQASSSRNPKVPGLLARFEQWGQTRKRSLPKLGKHQETVETACKALDRSSAALPPYLLSCMNTRSGQDL